ncbi:hypothetical protein, partial [uncultured Neglectibacter sp.]|uniref:hypothetical protein n=1 Tax=uncultured Neglectibacter sp. TaxID=1924108 RepID=UPI0034DFA0BD
GRWCELTEPAGKKRFYADLVATNFSRSKGKEYYFCSRTAKKKKLLKTVAFSETFCRWEKKRKTQAGSEKKAKFLKIFIESF